MITASLVLYNTKKEYLNNIIDSYHPSKDRLLFLIDNSPEKNKVALELQNKYIIYIFNSQNLGYGKANNIGIRKGIELHSDYHLILNPDLKFEPGILEELEKYADIHPDVVYMLPKIIYPDGRIQYLCKLLPTPADLIIRRFFPNVGLLKRLNDRYILKNSGYDHIINPPCLSGCFMFMRTSTLEKNNLYFDEQFFMYCEDFDLIRRLHRVGKTLYYPNVTVVHNHEHASYKNKSQLKMHIQSACRYFNKYGWFIDKERKEQNQLILNSLNDKGENC